MKHSILALVLSLSATVASAGVPTVDPTPPTAVAPTLNNVSIEVGPECLPNMLCPAVEEWVDVTFDYSSCGQQSFSVVTENTESGVQLSVVLDSLMDCKGPTKVRTYTVQVESIAPAMPNYVLMNKIGVLPVFPHFALPPSVR